MMTPKTGYEAEQLQGLLFQIHVITFCSCQDNPAGEGTETTGGHSLKRAKSNQFLIVIFTDQVLARGALSWN